MYRDSNPHIFLDSRKPISGGKATLEKLSSKFSLIASPATKLPNWLNDNFLRQGRKMNWLYKMFIFGKFATNTR